MDFSIIQVDLPWNGQLSDGNQPVAIIDHHAESKSCTVFDIHQWHLDRGWVGIGYQYFIRKDGTIYKGRPDWARGAHTIPFNANSIGICHEGAFGVETMPDIQREASIWLHKKLLAEYPAIKNIYTHGMVWATSCAGINFPLGDIIAGIAVQEVPAPQPVEEPKTERSWLQVGDSGDRVRELQEKLNRLGYGVSVDGEYTKALKNAVYRFQQDTKISADGLAGNQTFAKLNEKIAALDVPPAPKHEVDPEDLEAQQGINKLRIASLAEDGISGPKTKEAVKAFQSIAGIDVDGIVGSETLEALRNILSKPTCGRKYVQPFASRYIQWRLGIGVDGIFGRGTEAAVKAWQSSVGLGNDGVVGPRSWAALIG